MDEDGKKRILVATIEEIQHLADIRFGKGNIKVVPEKIREGSIEIGVILIVVAGAAYKFFKDYEALKKGVSEFTKDIGCMSRKLFKVVKKKYQSEEKKIIKKTKE
jgi:hypothetical protein